MKMRPMSLEGAKVAADAARDLWCAEFAAGAQPHIERASAAEYRRLRIAALMFEHDRADARSYLESFSSQPLLLAAGAFV